MEKGQQPTNLAAGDEIRTWSRVRVQHNFLPHYLDQPLLFQSRILGSKRPLQWSGEKLDYILLSALSSSPNQLFYLPTKTNLPERDKAEIRKWLDWGRANIAYLKVRKDLPAWPGAAHVDGSAHLVGDSGLIFLFNPGPAARAGEFDLSLESIGLAKLGTYVLTQKYPDSSKQLSAQCQETVRWEVPAKSVVVLSIQPAVR